MIVVALTCGAMTTSEPRIASRAAISVGAGDEGGTADTSGAGYVDNPYIPENRNVGDCASSLPRPDCGSAARGGPTQLLTMAALMLGMAFIGWRISVGVRRRDRPRDPDAAASSGPGR